MTHCINFPAQGGSALNHKQGSWVLLATDTSMLLPHGLLGDITQIITFALYRVATLMDALREIFMTALKLPRESGSIHPYAVDKSLSKV